MSDDDNSGDKTQLYDSGAATDEKSDLKNVLAENLARLDRLEFSEHRTNRVDPSESSSSKSAQITRGRRETNFEANLAPSNRNRIIHGPSPQAAVNGSEANELQEQFNSLKSSLDRVILPP